jgi:hypothetical protein
MEGWGDANAGAKWLGVAGARRPGPCRQHRFTRAALLQTDPARITARKAFPSHPTGAARPGYTKPQGSEPKNRARGEPGPGVSSDLRRSRSA